MRQYTLNYGLDRYRMRCFNVYGRRHDPNGAYAAVIPKFIECLLRDEPPTINGDGERLRDFVYVEDVVQINHLACAAPHEAAGVAYNVLVGKRSSLNGVYAVLSKFFGAAFCVGKSHYVSACRNTESILHDNGISAPFFRNFPIKRETREEKKEMRAWQSSFSWKTVDLLS